MALTGGCFCGEVRYAAEGPPRFRGQCFCRTCQMLSGGAGNMFLVVQASGFAYAKGRPKSFTRTDGAPTRDFCEICGVHLTACSPLAPGVVLIKVGTLDDPAVFGGPEAVYWTGEKQEFHLLPPGVPAHERPKPQAPQP